MATPAQDQHRRPGHPYPEMPDGIRICDDETTAGDYFFYQDRQLIVHADDLPRIQESLRSFGLPPDRYEPIRSPVDRPLVLLQFSVESEVDTIDVYRRLRFTDPDAHTYPGREPDSGAGPANREEIQERPEPGAPRVWPNHVVGFQYHTNWGAGGPPRPHPPLSPLPTGDNLPGAGVRVGVLDSGIEDQQWFDGRWSPAAGRDDDAVKEEPPAAGPLPYQCGHGTFCAGTVLQHAPGAHLIVDRLEHTAGCINDWRLHEHLFAMLNTANDLHVLNLSLGCYTANNRPLPCTCDVLTAAFDENPDLIVVASAGNDGHDRPVWPAAMRRVIGVGAVAANGGRWPLSNFGEWVNAWSVGENLSSTFLSWPKGPPPLAGHLEPGPRVPAYPAQPAERYEGWATWDGTSFAAARVSGALAAELNRDGRSARDVVFDLVANAPSRFESGGLVVPATYVN
jgi:hypothetical protein